VQNSFHPHNIFSHIFFQEFLRGEHDSGDFEYSPTYDGGWGAPYSTSAQGGPQSGTRRKFEESASPSGDSAHIASSEPELSAFNEPLDRINSQLKTEQSRSHSRSDSLDLDFEDDLDVEVLENIENIVEDSNMPKLKKIRSSTLPLSSSSSSSLLSSSSSAVSAVSVPLSSTPLEVISLTRNHQNENENEIGGGSVSTRDEVVRAFASFVTTPSANILASSVPVAQKSKDKMGGALGYGGDFSGVPTQLSSASASVIPSSSSSSTGRMKADEMTSSTQPSTVSDSNSGHSPSSQSPPKETPKVPDGYSAAPPTWSRSVPPPLSHTLSEAQAHAQSMIMILAVSGVLIVLLCIYYISVCYCVCFVTYCSYCIVVLCCTVWHCVVLLSVVQLLCHMA
jgi:trimeric autotransporter adhesin